MPARLTARKVATVGPGSYPDGGGLYLCVSASLNRTWIFRFSWRGRRPEMGLGSFDAGIGLAEARVARDEARRILTSGLNPIERRKETRRVLTGKPTFWEIANALLEAKRPEWRNAKHKEQWRASLMKDAYALRSRPDSKTGPSRSPGGQRCARRGLLWLAASRSSCMRCCEMGRSSHRPKPAPRDRRPKPAPKWSDALGRERQMAPIVLHGPTAGRLRFQPSHTAPS